LFSIRDQGGTLLNIKRGPKSDDERMGLFFRPGQKQTYVAKVTVIFFAASYVKLDGSTLNVQYLDHIAAARAKLGGYPLRKLVNSCAYASADLFYSRRRRAMLINQAALFNLKILDCVFDRLKNLRVLDIAHLLAINAAMSFNYCVFDHKMDRQSALIVSTSEESKRFVIHSQFAFALAYLRASIVKVLAGFRASKLDHTLAGAADRAYFSPERGAASLRRSLIASRAFWHM
jgi:hypothetical protein